MTSNKPTVRRISPYALCWLSIPFILLPGLYFKQHILDFQLYDTYYVIGMRQYVIAVAVLIWFFGIMYWTLNKAGRKLNYLLSVLHVITTILVFIIIALSSARIRGSLEIFFVILVVFAASQIAFLVNIFRSFARK